MFRQGRGLVFRVLLATLLMVLSPAVPAQAGNVSLLVIDGDSYLADLAVSEIKLPDGFKVSAFTQSDLSEPGPARDFIEQSRVILVDVMSNDLSRYISENNLVSGRDVYALRGSRDDQGLMREGFKFNPEIREYFSYLSKGNLKGMILKAINLSLDGTVDFPAPEKIPMLGIYHPDAPSIFESFQAFDKWRAAAREYDPLKPTVGLMLFAPSLVPGQVEAVNAIIRRLEQASFNVVPCFGKDRAILTDFFLDSRNKKPRVDIVVSFSLKFYSSLDDEIDAALAGLDIPIINAVNLYSQDIDAWRRDPMGIQALDVVWTVASPEISGLIEPTPLTGKTEIINRETGRRFYVRRAIEEQVDRLIPRLRQWVNLRRKPNHEKKTAILYYNHSPGKQNVGASYLNVCRSLEIILDRLRREGFHIPAGVSLKEDEITAMIQRTGRNIGSWAPGELEALLNRGRVVRVELEEYLKWFQELPGDFQEKVIKQWGRPETSQVMIKDGYFVIPAIMLGNVVLMPEPSRGWSDDPMKLYHDPQVYPHHQYIAAYIWLKKGFEADAVIHLGTHATHEWLPGKQAGLSPSCAPEVLITDIPNLYPYIIDDVAEGLQAKRRGRGVVIDHLTPSLKVAGLYNEYDELRNLVGKFDQASALESDAAGEYLKQIAELVRETGLDKDLGLKTVDKDATVKIDMFLHELDDSYIPYGLHTFGLAPLGQALDDTVKAATDSNPGLKGPVVKTSLVNSGPREIDNLIAGLNGRYIPSGEGGDPIRNPASLPSGKNFHGFSPFKIPSPAAWELGCKAGRDIISRHLEKHGQYPQKTAVALWAVETLRNEGVNESTILFLMGIRPSWDPNGRVKGTEVIPAAELNRPRLDVLISPSGLYRDLFPDKLLFLDEAVQKAAAQTDLENLISRHNSEVKQRLLVKGLSEKQADRLSRVRIFTEMPGSYGNRVSEMASASGFWDDDADIADVFIKQTGFAYGLGMWGEPGAQALTENLRDADTAVHSISSNLYGTMDNDDMFAYLGGLSLAIRKTSGKTPDTLISMQRNSGQVDVENLAKTLGRELRTRYLNPRWIQGMKQENYAGAREMSNFVENMWGWQVVTPEAVDASFWDQTYEVYVEDKYGQDLEEFFSKQNPWARQSLTARMLEAIRKDYWKADEKIKKNLAVQYAADVIAKGPACCDHTCNNPMLNQMVVNIISLPGVMSPALVKEFKLAVEKATGKPLEKQVEERARLKAALKESLKARPRDKAEAENKTDASREDPSQDQVKGYKLEDIKSDDDTSEISSSGVQWFAALFTMALIVLFAVGARKGR